MNNGLSELPPITITRGDRRRLIALVNSNAARFPRVVHFLARELERADVVPDQSSLRGVVRMGSKVTYRDEATARIREVTLVYPDEANIQLNRISILAPVGVALIGVPIGQTIEFKVPTREKRALTVLGVSD